MFLMNVRFSWRFLKRNPLFFLINVVGLVIGITSALLIFIYVSFEASFASTESCVVAMSWRTRWRNRSPRFRRSVHAPLLRQVHARAGAEAHLELAVAIDVDELEAVLRDCA